MESIVKDHLVAYLLTNNLITKQQHGFLAKHSTCSQLIECINDWSIELNCRNAVDVAYYIDVRNAFYSVVCGEICYKLKSYGVNGTILQWITNFLINRIQAV